MMTSPEPAPVVPGYDLPRLCRHPLLGGVEWFEVLGSTNDHAAALARDRSTELRLPLLVLAQKQTAGRGRHGRNWHSSPGAITFSLLLNPDHLGVSPHLVPRLALTTAVSIIETLRTHVPAAELGLHWPNDVYHRHRKIAGILIEAVAGSRVIIGVGLNVNNLLSEAPDDVRTRGTTLQEITGTEHDSTEILWNLLSDLQQRIEQLARQPMTLGRQFDQYCFGRGEPVRINTGSETVAGLCHGIAADGALLVQTPSGIRPVYSGSSLPLS